MAREVYFDPNRQLWSSPFQENNSNLGSQISYQDARYALGSMNRSVQTNQTNSGTSFEESSVITGLDSSSSGGSYSRGHGYNRVESRAPIQQARQLNSIASRMLLEKQNPHQQENVSSLRSVNVNVQSQPASNTVITGELAIRKLNAYVHHRRQRPPDNNILYWKMFVAHFYSPHATKRTCFSKHAHSGSHVQGDFALMGARQCKVCGSSSGNGFVETFDALPRMNQLYFNSLGVVDELLYLRLSMEKKFPDRSLMVYFERAVQESIYRHCRVVHEGSLRVFFTPELKIRSWDFCVQHHEVLLPRNIIASQVNEVKNAIRCQNNVVSTGRNGTQKQDLAAAAARKLSTMVEQPIVSDLGLSKHFVRNLQVAEVFNTMKDLMTSSLDNNTSPIETLQQYNRKSTDAKLETKHLETRPSLQHTLQPVKQQKFPAHCQTHPTGLQMMPVMYESLISPAQSAQNRSDIEKLMLNDILAYMQSKRTKHAQSENILHGGMHKKRRTNEIQMNNELIIDQILGSKSENGKGFNSSCSSNSPRMFHGRDLFNRDKDVDEDFTSPSQTQMLSKNTGI